jgi:hypothetical protein
MLRNYLLAGGADNEDFCFPLRGLKVKLDQELLVCGYMDKASTDAHMLKEKLDYKSIMVAASKPYKKQLDLGAWPPA